MIKLLKCKTPEERQAEQESKLLRAQQLKEATFYAQMIPNALARMKIAAISKEKNKLKINKVRLEPPVVIHEDYYMVHVNTRRLPFGIKLDILTAEETLRTLSAACRTSVEFRFTPREGLWYLIPRRGGLGIIPNIVNYDDVIKLIPKSANRWACPIGVGENKRLVWIDIRHTPHMLIIGSTGTGKTVFLKSMIFTLAMNCSPKRLRFVICDFKRGPDFKALAGLPHLGTPSAIGHQDVATGALSERGEIEKERIDDHADRILIHMEEIINMLTWSMKEIDRRNALFDEDITSIVQWNMKHRRKPLPHIIIIIDEIGVIMNRLPSKQQTALTVQLADIAMLGRSAGLHLILGLQKLSAKILNGAISDNIDARIVGVCASGPQSATAMGNGSWAAVRLPKIKGRAMWRDTHGEVELQLPWVAPKLASEKTDAVINKWSDGQEDEDILAMDIFKWCLETDHGHYDKKKIYQHWRKFSVTMAQVAAVRESYLAKEVDGAISPIFKIDDIEYVLAPHIPGGRPARVMTLAKYTEPEPEPEPEPEKPEVDPMMLFRYSIEELGGKFTRQLIFERFRGEVGDRKIHTISKEWEGRPFDMDGVTYCLQPPEAANKPRRITVHRASCVKDGSRLSHENNGVAEKIPKSPKVDLAARPVRLADKKSEIEGDIIAPAHSKIQPAAPDEEEIIPVPDWLIELPEDEEVL